LDGDGKINPDPAIAQDVDQVVDYYPFGLAMSASQAPVGTPAQNYTYNGKELQDELGLGWLDYGARMYDPSIARWNGVDALAENEYSWSPFRYGYNNPILFIDPDGNLETDYYKRDGSKIHIEDGIDQAYLVSDETFEDAGNLQFPVDIKADLGSASEFDELAGTVYAEGDATKFSKEEAAGIFDVLENRADALDSTPLEVVRDRSQQVNGYDEKDKINDPTANPNKVKATRAGVILGMTTPNGEKDYSSGATTWHGRDLKVTPHYKNYGITFTKESHNILGLKNNPRSHTANGKSYTNKYETTGAAGRTVFMKRTSASLNAEWPNGVKKSKSF
jgi:RHS repeat-associated protein